MCSHAGKSNTKQPIAPLRVSNTQYDAGQWHKVMHKGHELAYKRQQQESTLTIDKEIEVKQLRYPQTLLAFAQEWKRLPQQHSLKFKIASTKIQQELMAAAKLLQAHVEQVMSEQYLYITKKI